MTRPPIRPEQHGTITGYSYGCRDACCRQANTERGRRLRKASAMQRPGPAHRLPAAPTHRLVVELHDAGYSDKQLARYAGLNPAHIFRLRQPGGLYVTRETAQRIDRAADIARGITPINRLAARYVSTTGARRRLRALMAIGWDHRAIAEQLGKTPRALSPLLYTDRQITPRLHTEIVDLYERLWRTPGPSDYMRRHAARKGWPTPLELDDDRIDDPTYAPTLHRLDDVAQRRQRKEDIADRRRQVLDLLNDGLPVHIVARRLGVSADVVQADRKRAVS